jgi:hypothetical protein
MSRVGNFTSSQVYRLCTFGRSKDSIGATFYTYVQEKLREHRTSRPIGKEQTQKVQIGVILWNSMYLR